MSEKYLVFHVEGGLGKNIASTAVAAALKKEHPDRKLIIVASWPEVYLNNPIADRVYRVGITPYFYDDYIKDKDTIVLRKEPYFENDHMMKNTPLHHTWFNMYDLEYDPKVHKPSLPMNMMQASYISQWKRNKPTLLIHTNGGPFDQAQQPHSYSWTRDMPTPIAQEVVKRLSGKYHIFQLCRQNSFIIQGAETINKPMSNYELFALLCSTDKRLLIDSCMQHAAAAYNLKSTVLWVGTSPDMFGYKLHTNIQAKAPSNVVKNIDGYLFDYDFNGHLHQCPFSDANKMFNPDEVIKALQ